MSTYATTTRLTVLGLISLLLYTLLAAQYPVIASLQDPRSSWVRLVDAPKFALAMHLGLYAAAMLVYVLVCQLVWQRTTQGVVVTPRGADSKRESRAILGVIVVVWLLASFVLLGVAPGGESHDLFDYLFRGRMWVEYGGNPLVDVPRQFATAPFYRYVSWHSHVDTYGPIWEYVSGGVAILARTWLQAAERWDPALPSCPKSTVSCQMLLAYLSGYRLLAIALAGLCGWLIYLLVRHVRPQGAYLALLIWLWNPLLLTASAVGAHNDLLLLALLLFAFLLFQRQFWFAGLLMVVAAAHVKITALILAPVIGLWLLGRIGWRHTLGRGAALIIIAVPLSWLLYAPLGGWDTLPRMLHERSLFVANSPSHLLYRLLYVQRQWSYATVWYLTIFYPPLLFAVASLAYSLRRFGFRLHPTPGVPKVDDTSLWTASAVVTILFLALGSYWFQHWYVLWVLMPCALLPASPYTRQVLPWLCLGALMSNLLGDFVPQLPEWQFGRTQMIASIVAIIWLPALIATVFIWWRERTFTTDLSSAV